MNIEVEKLPDYRVAYVRRVGPYGPDNQQVMEKLKKWAAEKNLLNKSAIILGVPQDNPETTLSENCRYDACIVIPKDFQVDDSISEGKLLGGHYVICRMKHTAEEIQKTWSQVIPAILGSGLQIDNKPILERYTMEMINNNLCEICVPINN